MAMGSAGEVEYELIVAHDLRIIPDDTYREMVQAVREIKRMLTALMARARGKGKAVAQGHPETSITGSPSGEILKTDN